MSYTIGSILRGLREERGLPLFKVQEGSGIDCTLLSRIETGKRLPTIEQVQRLASLYEFDDHILLVQRESDRIISDIESNDLTKEALNVVSDKLKYGKQYLKFFQDTILEKPISLESRRYIGSKAKLTSWIMDIIGAETSEVNSFCDIFAGTGTVANQAISKYSHVIINDFLYSNNVIYKAFFGDGCWDRKKLADLLLKYNSINPSTLPNNYFSDNFGGKYYEYDIAKQIGFIRQDIENLRISLTDKEYNILLATLIYNIDRLANTVGHFEAYIKKSIPHQDLRLRLINAKCYKSVEIFQKDANSLAREIEPDLVYIDPPYNSRQYSRFYHLYETLIKWDMPELYGVALKPKAENMSRYCTFKAEEAFSDLVSSLRCKYIVVSYNNTYNSKSHSSENRIKLEDIERILSLRGKTKVFEHSHPYFNAGKTELEDHKELLFVTKIR